MFGQLTKVWLPIQAVLHHFYGVEIILVIAGFVGLFEGLDLTG